MSSQPWSAWYKTWRWQKLRERHLRANPLCVMCEAEGRVTEATVCDHIEPHKGDPEKFWNGPFQSLCKAHHDSDKQRLEKSGRRKVQIGTNGYPIEGTDQQGAGLGHRGGRSAQKMSISTKTGRQTHFS